MLLASLFLVLATPAATAAPVNAAPTIPVDTAARAKFPKETGELIDVFAEANREVNHSITYVSDIEHYGVEDHWVSFPEDSKGDCEDFAMTKLELLERLGFPLVTHARLRFVTVLDHGELYGHAIAEFQLPNGSILFLDNNYDEPMTRPELVARGYTFYDW